MDIDRVSIVRRPSSIGLDSLLPLKQYNRLINWAISGLGDSRSNSVKSLTAVSPKNIWWCLLANPPSPVKLYIC